MPILKVRALPQRTDVDIKNALSKTCLSLVKFIVKPLLAFETIRHKQISNDRTAVRWLQVFYRRSFLMEFCLHGYNEPGIR